MRNIPLISFLFICCLVSHATEVPKLFGKHTDKSLNFTISEVVPNALFRYTEQRSNGTQGVAKFQHALGNQLSITALDPATFYRIEMLEINGLDTSITPLGLHSTTSESSGEIRVYFNFPVNNAISTEVDAIYVQNFEDTLISYINLAKKTLDICNYNTGRSAIVGAVNHARSRGVAVRYIASKDNIANNSKLDELDASVPMIQSNSNGVMHNKFMIIDVEQASECWVVTGSTNHTNSNLFHDPNNLIIIQDQALAMAYKLEFEEMWGSTTLQPDVSKAKFGEDKTDNTPHHFTIGERQVELYFSPSDNTTSHIKAAIETADEDINFAMLTFINNDLGKAVVAKQNSGINAKGIIENYLYFGSEYNRLRDAGVDVQNSLTHPGFLHHKYALIDPENQNSDPIVVTGSHNWTNSAEEENDENTLIIHDYLLAQTYLEEFYARFDELVSVGLSETSHLNVNVFPNPAADKLIISSNDATFLDGNVTFKIYDLLGRKLRQGKLSEPRNVVHLDEFPKGSYNLVVNGESAVFRTKFFVE